MKLLTGKEVYRLSVDLTKQMTKPKEGSNATPRAYWRAKYDGIGFTVDQAFIDAFTKGEVVEIGLSEGSRTVDDALNPGTKKTVPSLAFNHFATKDQMIGMAKFDQEIKLIENPVVSNIDVDDELIAKLQAALAPKQLA